MTVPRGPAQVSPRATAATFALPAPASALPAPASPPPAPASPPPGPASPPPTPASPPLTPVSPPPTPTWVRLVNLGSLLALWRPQLHPTSPNAPEGQAEGARTVPWFAGPPSSSGLGHRPFKAAARVRIPLGVRSKVLVTPPFCRTSARAPPTCSAEKTRPAVIRLRNTSAGTSTSTTSPERTNSSGTDSTTPAPVRRAA